MKIAVNVCEDMHCASNNLDVDKKKVDSLDNLSARKN